jgi:hypothetical protein
MHAGQLHQSGDAIAGFGGESQGMAGAMEAVWPIPRLSGGKQSRLAWAEADAREIA